MQLSVLHDQISFLTNVRNSEYTDAQMNVNLTRWAHLLTTEVLDSMDGWDFQFDTGTDDLEKNVREYTFPSELLTIKKIQLKLDGTNWKEATLFDVSESGIPIASETDITTNFNNDEPYIDMGGRSFYIYSGTITAVSDGIKFWYTEEVVGTNNAGADITVFATDTDKPNLAESFQRGLVYGAAKDYFQRIEMTEKAVEMDRELEKIIARMKDFYSHRVADRKYRMMSANDMSDYD